MLSGGHAGEVNWETELYGWRDGMNVRYWEVCLQNVDLNLESTSLQVGLYSTYYHFALLNLQ